MKQNFYVIIVILSMTVLSSSINAKSMGIVDMQISLIDPSINIIVLYTNEKQNNYSYEDKQLFLYKIGDEILGDYLPAH